MKLSLYPFNFCSAEMGVWMDGWMKVRKGFSTRASLILVIRIFYHSTFPPACFKAGNAGLL